MSSDRTYDVTVVKHRETTKQAKLIALRAKERIKRKVEFLETTFEIEKNALTKWRSWSTKSCGTSGVIIIIVISSLFNVDVS